MKRIRILFRLSGIVLLTQLCFSGCNKKPADSTSVSPGTPGGPPVTTLTDVEYWLTRADQLALLKKQSTELLFTEAVNSNPTIVVDSAQSYQVIDGFGGCLTGGSAYLINKMPDANKDLLLKELFTTDSSCIGISYIRISMGASDLSTRVFSYNDLPPGQTDLSLSGFNLKDDLIDLIPVLKKIVLLNPNIKILASPWSAPSWMKTNNSSIGGSLKTEYYNVYAQYFVKYIQAMRDHGIPIDAITLQNEPLNPYNNPSMTMQAKDQSTFIKNHLGPAFSAANITTKIIMNENNPDIPEYPISILGDPGAYQYTDGSAFHLYGGDISGLSLVHNAHPEKNIYFTEQWVGYPGDFGAYLNSHVKLLLIGASRNWSRNVLEWNLASDPGNNPHTPGGCTMCLGSITIDGDKVSRNVGYYIIAHAAKFIPSGSVRIASNYLLILPNVAFKTPQGKKVLIVLNDTPSQQVFNIEYKGKIVSPTLPAGAVGTFVW